MFQIKEYKKLNSFAELNIKNDSDNKNFFDLLKKKQMKNKILKIQILIKKKYQKKSKKIYQEKKQMTI